MQLYTYSCTVYVHQGINEYAQTSNVLNYGKGEETFVKKHQPQTSAQQSARGNIAHRRSRADGIVGTTHALLSNVAGIY
jgi:hypothetical protein